MSAMNNEIKHYVLKIAEKKYLWTHIFSISLHGIVCSMFSLISCYYKQLCHEYPLAWQRRSSLNSVSNAELAEGWTMSHNPYTMHLLKTSHLPSIKAQQSPSPTWILPYLLYPIRQLSKQCPERCEIVYDHRLLDSADAVIFHPIDMKDSDSLPASHPPRQPWIFFSLESPSSGYFSSNGT